MKHVSLEDNQKRLTKPLKKVIWSQVHQLWSWYVVLMSNGPTEWKKFKTDYRKKPHKKQIHQIWSWFAVFIKHGPIGDNQECLKQTTEENHLESGPSNMILVYSVYQTVQYEVIT